MSRKETGREIAELEDKLYKLKNVYKEKLQTENINEFLTKLNSGNYKVYNVDADESYNGYVISIKMKQIIPNELDPDALSIASLIKISQQSL